MRSFLALLLIFVTHANCDQNHQYFNESRIIDSSELVSNPCQDVRTSGFICVDCFTLGYCTHTDNQWNTVPLTTCESDNGFHCSDEGTFGCTLQPSCKVPVRGKFFCQQSGIFPDPYDCRNYHECDEQNVDTSKHCTNGYGYSLLTETCSLPKESDQCESKQYTCEYLGQAGVWEADNHYYYICQKDTTDANQEVFYPLMKKCHEGYIFNGFSCVAPQ